MPFIANLEIRESNEERLLARLRVAAAGVKEIMAFVLVEPHTVNLLRIELAREVASAGTGVEGEAEAG